MLYGVLTAIFPRSPLADDQKTYVNVGFYVIAICETILTTAVSCTMRVISFKGTHLVQRMSLLTLIILGEGIIVVTKCVATIIKNGYPFSAAVIGQVISSILIIVSMASLLDCALC